MSPNFLFGLIVIGLFAAVATVVFVLILRGDVRHAIGVAIVGWGVPYGLTPIPSLVYYTDSQGVVNSLGGNSLLLAFVFVALVGKEGAVVERFLRTPIFVAFYILFACAVLTQGWHLGLVPGIGLAYARVLQPMMVVVMLSYLASRPLGLRQAFLCLIGAVALAIAFRYAAGLAFGPGPASMVGEDSTGALRAGALGSWTIYGTICASLLPLVVALVAVDRSRVERATLILAGLFAVKEVLASGTRGAALGLAALLVFLLRRKARWWMTAFVVGILAAGVVLGFRTQFYGSRTLTLDVGSILQQENTRARFMRNQAALNYITERPLSGSGLGSPLVFDMEEIGTWVYNPYLAWGVAMGLPALLAFSAIMVLTVGYSIGNWWASTGTNRTLQVGLTAALAVWIINQFTTGDSLTYLQSVDATFLFYAILGLVLGSRLARLDVSSLAAARAN